MQALKLPPQGVSLAARQILQHDTQIPLETRKQELGIYFNLLLGIIRDFFKKANSFPLTFKTLICINFSQFPTQ